MLRNLDYTSAHTFVSDYKGPSEVYWSGWDICVFQKSRTAARHPKGSFRNGNWGFLKKFEANGMGVWTVRLER